MKGEWYVAAVLGSLAVLVVGCDKLPGKPTPAERSILASQVSDFNQLYSRHCAGCHGRTGQWGAARPLNDPLYLALVSKAILRQIIAQGVAGTLMPAFATSPGDRLSGKQLDGLVSGLQITWGRAQHVADGALPPYSLQAAITAGSGPGDPQRGRAVYTTYCAHCHGMDGTGGARGGAVVDSTYLALVSDQALRSAVIAGRLDLGMPDWRALVPGRAMSGQEISDVVAWLVSHRSSVLGNRLDQHKPRGVMHVSERKEDKHASG